MKTLLIIFQALLIVTYVEALSCPFGWTAYGAQCIRLASTRTTYTNAIQLCKGYGGRLIEPRNKAMSNYLYNILPATTSTTSAWLGIYNNQYASNGQPIQYVQENYQNYYAYLYKYPTATMNYNDNKWISTSSPYNYFYSYCELPRINTDCPLINTILVEDSFKICSKETCQDACASTVGCKFWTFLDGSCGLRFYNPNALVSGAPGSLTGFPNMQLPTVGMVLVGNAVQNVENPAACQKLCSEDPKCNSFTWSVDETCVFNYGESLKELTVPANGTLVSGPKCCNQKSSCNSGKGFERYVQIIETLPALDIATNGTEPLTEEETREAMAEMEERVRNLRRN